MTKQTNTSNNEELLCDICKKYPDNNCLKCNKIKQGIKQGYAKVLDELIEIRDDLLNWSNTKFASTEDRVKAMIRIQTKIDNKIAKLKEKKA